MHSSNRSARAANEADSRQRRGPANRRRSVHAGGAFKFKWMIEVEGPVTMHSSNSGARAANEADSRQRRGPANQRRSLHPGGGPPAKKTEKIYLRKKFNQKIFFFRRAFFFVIFLGELEILRGLVCSFVYVFGWIGTEGFGCSLLEDLGVILELFTQFCFC